MQVKFKGYKEKSKINIKMIIPTGEQKTVITMEMPQGGDWRADMECYDKVLSAYEERLDIQQNKSMNCLEQFRAHLMKPKQHSQQPMQKRRSCLPFLHKQQTNTVVSK